MAEVTPVRGRVAVDELGRTLPHEHLLIDLARVARNFEQTRLSSIMGCGWYREPYYDRDVYDKSTNQLADEIVRDILEGMDGTDVRARIIGEIGSHDRHPISPAEKQSVRAAARARQRTGASISSQAALPRVRLEQLDLLDAEGFDPSRVIIGHPGQVSEPDSHEAIARGGAWVQFDRIRGMQEWDVRRYVELIPEFPSRGFLHQLLLGQDLCMLPHLHAYGGTESDFLLTGFVERLRDAGLSQREIDVLPIDNPRDALAW